MTKRITTIVKPIIGGIQQGIIIRSTNDENPVLLFVHGGPGAPAYSLIKNDVKGLEDLFTVCYWEQRGSGMSFSKDIPLESMNLNQMIEDTAEVTRYLMFRFNKPKIYILGHSWGSFLSSFTINKYPELYHAYIGVGQMANTYQSEEQSYQFVYNEATKRNDSRALKTLKSLKLPAIEASGHQWYNYLKIQRAYVSKFGGASFSRRLTMERRALSILFCKEYTIKDKLNFKAGLKLSMLFWEYLSKNNLNVLLNQQQIPVYMFHGVHDYQTTYAVAREYFENLKAPLKKFYTFYNSAHWIFLDEYEMFEKILKTEIININGSNDSKY